MKEGLASAALASFARESAAECTGGLAVGLIATPNEDWLRRRISSSFCGLEGEDPHDAPNEEPYMTLLTGGFQV